MLKRFTQFWKSRGMTWRRNSLNAKTQTKVRLITDTDQETTLQRKKVYSECTRKAFYFIEIIVFVFFFHLSSEARETRMFWTQRQIFWWGSLDFLFYCFRYISSVLIQPICLFLFEELQNKTEELMQSLKDSYKFSK